MISPKVVSIFVVAAIAAIFTLGVTTSIFTTFPLGQQQAAAQQENTTASTTTTSTTNQTMASASSTNKTFYLFNTELEGADVGTTGVDTYIYSLPVIVANRGDSVTVNLVNIAETEEEEEATEEEEGTVEEEEEAATEEEGRHSFTIDTPPYRSRRNIPILLHVPSSDYEGTACGTSIVITRRISTNNVKYTS
jgi:hypothetical protein